VVLLNFTEFFGIDAKNGHADLDFVDIDIENDTALFIEPTLIESIDDDWYKECTTLINNFFDSLFTEYRNRNKTRILQLLDCAHEPNETRLGWGDKDSTRKWGHGNTADNLHDVFKEIIKANLLENGLIDNPMDLCVFVHDFAEDGMSDLVTNIIREKLNEFTLKQFDKYGIMLDDDPIPIGKAWCIESQSWEDVVTKSIVIKGRPLLLVPKNIVRQKYIYSIDQYMNRKILEHRQKYHVDNDTQLAIHRVNKYGDTIICKPSKKAIRKEEIGDVPIKDYARDYTIKNMSLIEEYRDEVRQKTRLGQYILRDEELDDILYGER
jgi:hypothetical protein